MRIIFLFFALISTVQANVCPSGGGTWQTPSIVDNQTFDNPQYLCGRIEIPSGQNIFSSKLIAGGNITDEARALREQALTNVLFEAQYALSTSAEEMLLFPVSQDSWQLISNPLSAARVIKRQLNQLNNNLKEMIQQNFFAGTMVQKAKADGWIHTGAYYFQLIRGHNVSILNNVHFPVTEIEKDKVNSILGECYFDSDLLSVQYIQKTTTKLTETNLDLGGAGSLSAAGASTSGKVRSALSVIFGGLMKKIVNSINSRLTQSNVDPLASMAALGADVILATEILFFSSLGAAFALWAAGSVMFCLQPLGPALLGLTSLIMPFATFMITVVYVAGAVLAIYVPLIPFLVFMFASLSWIILVIEAVIAAPLVAISFMIPSEDELGRAGISLGLLLGLMLRPGLMVIGFVLASKLLRIAFDMINFGFIAAYETSSMTTAFTAVALIFIYASIATAFVHEAFSLIYVLPDRILRWIGGQEESSSVKGQVKGLEGKAREGAGIAQKGMKAGMAKGSKAKMNKGKGGGGGGKGAVGAGKK